MHTHPVPPLPRGLLKKFPKEVCKVHGPYKITLWEFREHITSSCAPVWCCHIGAVLPSRTLQVLCEAALDREATTFGIAPKVLQGRGVSGGGNVPNDCYPMRVVRSW